MADRNPRLESLARILGIIGVGAWIPGYVTSNYLIDELDMARGTPDGENDGGDEGAGS